MRLVGKEKLAAFTKQHADARGWIANWVADVGNAAWKSTPDIKLRYRSASFLSENKVIFNVKGTTYRLEVIVAYQTQTVVVVWAGTHAEYTKRHK